VYEAWAEVADAWACHNVMTLMQTEGLKIINADLGTVKAELE